MKPFVITRPFQMRGDSVTGAIESPVYRPGDEGVLKKSGLDLEQLRRAGYISDRRVLANGATEPLWSWTEIKARCRALGIENYSKRQKNDLIAEIAAREGTRGPR